MATARIGARRSHSEVVPALGDSEQLCFKLTRDMYNDAFASVGTSKATTAHITSTSPSATDAPPVAASAKPEDVSPSYAQLLKNLRTITHLRQAEAVLHYDQMIFMPQASAASPGR